MHSRRTSTVLYAAQCSGVLPKSVTAPKSRFPYSQEYPGLCLIQWSRTCLLLPEHPPKQHPPRLTPSAKPYRPCGWPPRRSRRIRGGPARQPPLRSRRPRAAAAAGALASPTAGAFGYRAPGSPLAARTHAAAAPPSGWSPWAPCAYTPTRPQRQGPGTSALTGRSPACSGLGHVGQVGKTLQKRRRVAAPVGSSRTHAQRGFAFDLVGT